MNIKKILSEQLNKVKFNESDNELDEALIKLGSDLYPKNNNGVIFAGGSGCYPKGTEFFNGKYWKNIEEYVDTDKVLQYNLDGTCELVYPNDFVKIKSDKFIQIKNRRLDFTTSLYHKHLILNEKTKCFETKFTHELESRHYNLTRGNKCKLITSFNYNGIGLNLSNEEIKLKIAIYADGHFLKRVKESKVRFSLKKERKIKNLKEILNSNNITYIEYLENGFTRFEFNYSNEEKEFEYYWYNCNKKQFELICNEVLLWDGSNIELNNKKNRRAFVSTSKKSIDFIQFAFASCNIDTTISLDIRENRNICYNLTINNSYGIGISKNSTSSITTSFNNYKSEDNLMYCFTVTSGFFVVRQNNKIYVSGNSGKGFVKDHLLGIDGKVLDTDSLKALYMKSTKLRNSLKNDYGLDVDNFSFKNPQNVEQLHHILANKGVGEDQQKILFSSIQELQNKPNLIFDVTLSTVTRFYNIAKMFEEMGYQKDHIHLVWVLTDFNTAFDNNNRRSRVVPEIVFTDIHKGVSRTMKEILNMSNVSSLIDGDIYLVFNNPTNDTIVQKSANGGKYVQSANYVKIKEAGQPLKNYNEISKDIIDKINQYVHADTKW